MGKLFLLQELQNGFRDADVEVVRDCLDCKKWMDPECGFAYRSVEIDNIPNVVSALRHPYYPGDGDIIPVGSLEFVNRFLASLNKGPVGTIRIPETLQEQEWLGRRIFENISFDKNVFEKTSCNKLYIKPAKYAKEFESFVITPNNAELYLAELQSGVRTVFAEELFNSPIAAEWRVFVHDGRIVDARPYSLEDWVVPDRDVVQTMIRAYTEAPPAYTLDVAVLKSGKTVVVEIHNFISCGLYGFDNYLHLPAMLIKAWRYELRAQNRV